MTFFLFLVVALNTRAKTAKFTTPTIQRCLAQQQFPEKLISSSAWGRIYNLPL